MKYINRVPAIIPYGFKHFSLGNQQAIFKDVDFGLRILISIDPIENNKWEYHISFSRKDRYPTWEEMKDYLYDSDILNPNKEIKMILPAKNKPKEYVNIHKNCFHWYQEE